MLEKIDFTLFYYIGAIALVMIANTCLGIVKANKYNEFDWELRTDVSAGVVRTMTMNYPKFVAWYQK